MNGRIFKTITSGALVLAVALGAGRQARAADASTLYPSMPPLDQYLMERNAEIALGDPILPKAQAA